MFNDDIKIAVLGADSGVRCDGDAEKNCAQNKSVNAEKVN